MTEVDTPPSQAAVLNQQGKYREALALVAPIVERGDKELDAYIQMSAALRNLGEDKAARDVEERTLELFPDLAGTEVLADSSSSPKDLLQRSEEGIAQPASEVALTALPPESTPASLLVPKESSASPPSTSSNKSTSVPIISSGPSEAAESPSKLEPPTSAGQSHPPPPPLSAEIVQSATEGAAASKGAQTARPFPHAPSRPTTRAAAPRVSSSPIVKRSATHLETPIAAPQRDGSALTSNESMGDTPYKKNSSGMTGLGVVFSGFIIVAVGLTGAHLAGAIDLTPVLQEFSALIAAASSQ